MLRWSHGPSLHANDCGLTATTGPADSCWPPDIHSALLPPEQPRLFPALSSHVQPHSATLSTQRGYVATRFNSFSTVHLDVHHRRTAALLAMYLHVPLLLFLLANVVPSNANVFTRGSESITRAAKRARHNTIKRSSGLIRDLRLAYSGTLVDQQADSPGKYYCVKVDTDETSSTNGTRSGSSSVASLGAKPSATATSSSAPAASSSAVASSPWKLKQSYEGNSFFAGWSFFTDTDPTGGTVDYIDGSAAVRLLVHISTT